MWKYADCSECKRRFSTINMIHCGCFKYTCGSCINIHLKDRKTCDGCQKIVCKDSIIPCEGCNIDICRKCMIMCELCSIGHMNICKECIIVCAGCDANSCLDCKDRLEMNKCEKCDNIRCFECFRKCNECNMKQCKDCVYKCACGKMLCYNCLSDACKECKSNICKECFIKCIKCDRNGCGSCIKICDKCDTDLCDKCTIYCDRCERHECETEMKYQYGVDQNKCICKECAEKSFCNACGNSPEIFCEETQCTRGQWCRFCVPDLFNGYCKRCCVNYYGDVVKELSNVKNFVYKDKLSRYFYYDIMQVILPYTHKVYTCTPLIK
jgi:hypothetical protein